MSTLASFSTSETSICITASCAELALLIRASKDSLLSTWRTALRARMAATCGMSRRALDDHIPVLLDEIVAALERAVDVAGHPQVGRSTSSDHGLQRLADGFSVEEVVTEYNILRDCMHDLAERNGRGLSGKALHILNGALDTAIGTAIKAYVAQQARDTRQRREDYLAFLAHDLRTPLSAVAVSAHLIDADTSSHAPSSRLRRALDTLQRNVGALTRLVDKVLEENAGLDDDIRLERRDLELWPLAESLVRELQPIADAGRTVLFNQVPETLRVSADATMLRRILQNLVSNAIKHAHGGEVRITASERDGEPGTVVCEVADNGSGIPADRLPHIFEKFESDDREQGDLGLGLTICRSFVQAHGGEIAAGARAGGGTVMRFTLPAQRD